MGGPQHSHGHVSGLPARQHLLQVDDEVGVRLIAGHPEIHAHISRHLVVVAAVEGKGGEGESLIVHAGSHVPVPGEHHALEGAPLPAVKDLDGGVHLVVGGLSGLRLLKGEGAVVFGGAGAGFLRCEVKYRPPLILHRPGVGEAPALSLLGADHVVGVGRALVKAVVHAL